MEYQQKKLPLVLIFAIILVVGVALGYGYYYSQHNLVKDQVDQADKEIVQIKNKLEEISESETVSAQKAVKALEIIEKREVLWSDVLSILDRIVPNDPKALQQYITFTSYSGSEGGRLTFNGYTIASTDVQKQLNDIADTIIAFNEISEFEGAFVPSISKSVNEAGEVVLSIIFNANYIPSAQSSAFETSEEDESEGVRRR
jgi:hypothetical protein